MPNEPLFKRVIRLISSASMVAVGVLHFAAPDGFVKIVPAFLPAPLFLVYLSGFFEIVGGLGLLVDRLRRAAGLGLVALYVAVFPANINMAVHAIQPAGAHIPTALLWLRLPFQLLFIGVAWWLSRPSQPASPR
ncbi:hypothetical protein BH11MYX4_BH11MYX4_60660 [soil metagenome]